jgi:hypothetical protein
MQVLGEHRGGAWSAGTDDNGAVILQKTRSKADH